MGTEEPQTQQGGDWDLPFPCWRNIGKTKQEKAFLSPSRWPALSIAFKAGPGIVSADYFPIERKQMNPEFKLNPMNEIVLTGSNTSLTSDSRLSELHISPTRHSQNLNSPLQASPSLSGHGLDGKYGLQLLSGSEVPQQRQAPGSGELSPHATLFLSQEFPSLASTEQEQPSGLRGSSSGHFGWVR